MKLEKIRIFAEELGIEPDLNQLINAVNYVKGDYAFTEKGKAEDKIRWSPTVDKIRNKISKRLEIIFDGEFNDWRWTYGRISGICYVTLHNPKWG